MPEEIRAPCGVLCSSETCEVFKATLTDDNELRVKCLEGWRECASEHWGIELKLEDVNCIGCVQSDDAIFAPSYCPMSNCAKNNGFTSCGQCPDWKTCDWLTGLHADCPDAREYLFSQE